MLFEPERHEALRDAAWDAPRAREAIRSIVRDIEQDRVAAGHWRVHPLDDDGDAPRTGFKGLYLLHDHKTNKGLTITLWETQADMNAAEVSGFYQQQVAKMKDVLAAPPVREEYEVSLVP